MFTGTTRDVVEAALDLGGYPVNISDTAGLRPTEDVIEKEGINRALNRVEHADIALIIVDAAEITHCYQQNPEIFNLELFLKKYFCEVGILNEVSTTDKFEWVLNRSYVVLVNKIDLIQSEVKQELIGAFERSTNVCLTSLKTLEGLDFALNTMRDLCVDMCGSATLAETPYLTSQRQKTHIEACLKHIHTIFGIRSPAGPSELLRDEDDTRDLLSREETLTLAAQQLQLASNQLGYVTGHITTEDVLDHIFSSFCIGK